MTTLSERLKSALSQSNELSQAGLAKACGIKAPSVSDWLSGKTKKLEGSNLLAAAEYLHINPWWLATGKGSPQLNEPSKFSNPIKSNENSIIIKQYDFDALREKGISVDTTSAAIQQIQVNQSWIKENINHYSDAKNLALLTGFGDTMKPLFSSGDPLIIDTGINSVKHAGVYFFRIDKELYIKHLQLIPDNNKKKIIRAKSINDTSYDPFDIKEKMDFEILGILIKSWNSLNS